MDKKTEKFCVVCGKRIPELSLRRKVCSDFCRRRRKSGYAPYLYYKHPPFDDLTQIQQRAHAAGMSYGKYVAQMSNNQMQRG